MIEKKIRGTWIERGSSSKLPDVDHAFMNKIIHPQAVARPAEKPNMAVVSAVKGKQCHQITAGSCKPIAVYS